MMTRISKPDVSETDVSKEDEHSEEAASLFGKAGQDRQKLQGWPLCHDNPVSTFQKRWVAVLQGEHPFEIV